MSSSSSSASNVSNDDLGNVSDVDAAVENGGFNGWGFEEISFESMAPSAKTMKKTATDEPWPTFDENKLDTKKKKRLQIGLDEDEAEYEALMESEEEEDEESTLNVPPAVPKSPPCEEEEEESDEDRPDQPSQYQPVPKPAILPPPLELEGDSDSEFETEEEEEEEKIDSPPKGDSAKVEPVPKESVPELADRSDKTDEAKTAPAPAPLQQEETKPELGTAKDVQQILEKNLNEKDKVVNSIDDAAELAKLRDALKEFHQYAITPNEKRSATFKNSAFNAKSKDITSAYEKRMFLALKCLDKMVSVAPLGVKDEDKTRFTREPQSLSVSNLLTQISHALAAFVASQQNVPSQTRRELAKALIADVTKRTAAEGSVARTTIILSGTIGNMLISEAASLKTASLVTPSEEKKAKFDNLRERIVDDIKRFVNAISAAIPSAAATKKILEQISLVSANFHAAGQKFSPIAGKESASGDSYATALSVLLRQLALYGPSVTEFNANQGFAILLMFQANTIMPDLIMYPEVLYDVLAGMLDGLKGTFNVIDSQKDRAKIIAAWSEIKNDLSDQANYLKTSAVATNVSAAKSPQKETSTPTPTPTPMVSTKQPPKSTATEKKPSSANAMEEHFISRFSHISDDED